MAIPRAKRRRRVDPKRAQEAALGGFYSRIEATQAGWPSCATCGRKTALVDGNGECIRCALERKRQARETAPEAGGPF
jgi:hypothetical protein